MTLYLRHASTHIELTYVELTKTRCQWEDVGSQFDTSKLQNCGKIILHIAQRDTFKENETFYELLYLIFH